jgi:excisionase family DNA binding protein
MSQETTTARPPARFFVPEHFRPDDLADRLHVSVDTVRRWVDAGEFGRVIRPSSQLVLIPAPAVNRFLERHAT